MFYRTYRGHNHYTGGVGKGIRTSFMQGSSLTRLIYINCGVFLALKIIYSLFSLTGTGKNFYPLLLEWIGVLRTGIPAVSSMDLFTYMFTQFEFLHLLFNMLWLYWFGSFFLNYFSQRQLTGVYLWGAVRSIPIHCCL